MSDCVISFTLTVQSQIALLGRPFTEDERIKMSEAGEHLTGYATFPTMLQETCEKYLDVVPNEVISENETNHHGGWNVRNADGLEGYFAWLREDLKARTAEPDEYDSEWTEFYNDDQDRFAEFHGYAELQDFEYYQTHGGGPEGGFLYLDGDDKCLFAVERNWGTPWSFTHIPNMRLEVGVSDNVPSIRLLSCGR